MEALQRIPQTHFSLLPPGQSLVTNWPKHRGEHKGRIFVDPSPAKSHEESNPGGHHKRISLTDHENVSVVTGDSPTRSRTAPDSGLPQGRAPVAGPDNRGRSSRKSGSPNKPVIMTLTKSTNDVGPPNPSFQVVENKASMDTVSTDKPLSPLCGANASTNYEVIDPHIDISSKAPPYHSKEGHEFASRPSQIEYDAVTDSAPDRSTLFLVDNVQETMPALKNKKSNKRNKKPKPLNKAATSDKTIVFTPNNLPVLEDICSSKERFDNVESKAEVHAKVGKRDLQDGLQSTTLEISAAAASATSAGPNLVASQYDMIGGKPALAPPDADMPLIDKSKALLEGWKSAPSRDSHHRSSDGDKVQTVSPQSSELIASVSPLCSNDKPASQAMTRNTSKSRKGNAVSWPISTAPTSSCQSGRSDSVAESFDPTLGGSDAWLDQVMQSPPGVDPDQLRNKLEAQAATSINASSDRGLITSDGPTITPELRASSLEYVKVPRGMSSDQVSKGLASTTPVKMGGCAEKHIKGSHVATRDDVEQAKTKEVSPNQAFEASTATTPPRAPSSTRTPTTSQSPERKQTPEIPQRSSSLSISSTPIHTRLRKKPKKISPVAEEGRVEVVIAQKDFAGGDSVR